MSDSVKLENLLGMLTIKLNDDNFIKWNFQFCSVLRGYDLFDHFTGESVCPPKYVLTAESGVTKEVSTAYKSWIKTDMALLSLLLATLSDDAIEHVVGCTTSYEAWTALQDRYMSVSSASINHLKAELHTIQKGGDTVDKYLLRLKAIKDKLHAAGEKISDNDIIIAALTGLPADFDMIRTVILARESPITLKEFRAQLLGVEKTLENRMQSLVHSMAAMYSNAGFSTLNGNTGQSYQTSSSASNSVSSPSIPQNFGYGFIAPSSSNGSFHQSTSFNQPSSNHFNGFQPSGNNGESQGNRSYGTNNYKGKGNGGYKSKFNGPKSNNFWSGNTSTRQEVIPECQICFRKGHTAATCLYRNENNRVSQECQICGKRSHIALDCRHRGNYAYQGAPPLASLNANYAAQDFSMPLPYSSVQSHVAFPGNFGYQGPIFNVPSAPPGYSSSAALVNQGQSSNTFSGIQGNIMSSSPTALAAQSPSGGDSWIVDTGASHHMSPDVTILNTAVPYDGDKKIMVGNGEGQGNRGDTISRKE